MRGPDGLNLVPKAVLAGAEIRDRSRVVQIEVDQGGVATGVVYVRDGATHMQAADVVILSAFCIENPRLLLHSATADYPDGLANSSGAVGRFLLAHVADSHMVPFDDPVHMWSTAPGTLLSQHHYGTQPGRGFAGGWSWMTSSLFPAEFAITLVKGGERIWGADLLRRVRDYPRYVVLGTEGECLAYPENRVELSDELDEFGVPRPTVTFDYGENERAMRDEIHRRAAQILESAGARMSDLVISEGNDHTMGGCRMGADPSTSVVDPNLRAHDHPNLFICDASLFVTPGGAQPSLTIMALAVRLADRLRSRGSA